MFSTITINKWEDLNIIGDNLVTWVFRGHSNKSWMLKSSIERISTGFNVPLKLLSNREFWILRQFQRRAHLLISAPPPFSNKLEWLALIQHYGGPTRLVDFTYSIHIAAFFAIELASSDAAIWAVNLDAVQPSNVKQLSEETIDHLNQKNLAFVEQILELNNQSLGIVPVEPDRLNERMSIQKGIFLFPIDISKPFIENLCSAISITEDKLSDESARILTLEDIKKQAFQSDFPNLIKIIIPRTCHTHGIHQLDGVNINAQTLFPGLEGFARSLRKHLRIHYIS